MNITDRADSEENIRYEKTKMQREQILNRLREQGCRITKQRLTLLDIILEEECSCCKEIYYKASMKDSGIGMATVYRMINMLERIGAISRKNLYRISCDRQCDVKEAYTVELSDHTICQVPPAHVEQHCPGRAEGVWVYRRPGGGSDYATGLRKAFIMRKFISKDI